MIYKLLLVLWFDTDWAMKENDQRSIVILANSLISQHCFTFKFIFVLQSSPSFNKSH